MAGILTLSKEQTAQAKKSMEEMKKILDNKAALIAAGIVTTEDIDQVEAAYSSAKLLLEKFPSA